MCGRFTPVGDGQVITEYYSEQGIGCYRGYSYNDVPTYVETQWGNMFMILRYGLPSRFNL